MEKQEFIALLDRHPLIVTENTPALGLIPGLDVITDLERFQAELDSGSLDPARRYAILQGNSALAARFPIVNPTYDVFNSDLSSALFERLDTFHALMLHQEQVADRITSAVGHDVIVLVVVDGLSYRDCRHYSHVSPCLVTGITKTREGYRRVVGQPTLARRLAKHAYMNRIGFTYWDREDDKAITDQIFIPFSPDQMHKVRDFRAVIDGLQSLPLRRTYVQIVLQGLDYLSHGVSDEPLIAAHVQRLFERLESVEAVIRNRGRRGMVFMTADHGILWKQQHSLKKIEDGAWSARDGVRYLHGKIARDFLRHDSFDGSHYSLLKYPFIFRNLGPTEWGVHGGISYEESIVPFYAKEV